MLFHVFVGISWTGAKSGKKVAMSRQAVFLSKFGSTPISKYLDHVSPYSPTIQSQHERRHSHVGQDHTHRAPFFKLKILRIHDCGEKLLRKCKFRMIWN
jgi:hypothetical protein